MSPGCFHAAEATRTPSGAGPSNPLRPGLIGSLDYPGWRGGGWWVRPGPRRIPCDRTTPAGRVPALRASRPHVARTAAPRPPSRRARTSRCGGRCAQRCSGRVPSRRSCARRRTGGRLGIARAGARSPPRASYVEHTYESAAGPVASPLCTGTLAGRLELRALNAAEQQVVAGGSVEAAMSTKG